MNVTDEDEEEIVDELVEFWINNKKDGNVSEWEGRDKEIKRQYFRKIKGGAQRKGCGSCPGV